MIYKILLFLFMVLSLNADEPVKLKESYEALESKLACAGSEKEAIIKVDAILEKVTGISSIYLHSKNIYIRHKKNSKGKFCVEGIITKKGFDLYTAELDEEYESIMGDIEDTNDSISYTQKQGEVNRIYHEINSYNQKIDVAEKTAPLSVEKIVETKVTLNKKINATPVVKFMVNGCKGKYITGCQLVFVSLFQDDSSNIFYSWDFGDGAHSKRINPIHSYKQPGVYKVVLRVTDDGKKYTEFSKEVAISVRPKPKVKYKPFARFSTSKSVYVGEESIAFINHSSSQKSKIIECKWTFGDGGSSNLCTPKYSYKKAGVYKVQLEVLNSDGLRSDIMKNIYIIHPAIVFGINGRELNQIVRKYGQPEKSIVKSGTLIQAHRYGSDWLLVKHNQVMCQIKGSSFRTNLMGNPKNCRWYEKHARSAMYLFE